MTFRTRALMAGALGAVVPLVVFGFGLRQEAVRRLEEQYRARVDAISAGLRADLERRSESIKARLDALAGDLTSDERFRAGVLTGSGANQAYVLDYAGRAMRTAGLAMLQIQDDAGRIVSSGQFRNAFGRADTTLLRAIAAVAPAAAVVRAPTPTGALLVLARSDSTRIAGRVFYLVGGEALDAPALTALAGVPDVGVTLTAPAETLAVGDTAGSTGAIVARFALPSVAALAPGAATDTARVLVSHAPRELDVLRGAFDRWLAFALLAAVLAAVLLAALLAGGLTRPLTALAEQASAIELERLETSFPTERTDEIGALARILAAMTDRLRLGAERLREVERRATTGELARQVNHDVKNGLIPVRNVVRHLAEVARDDPASLPGVFAERHGTLERGLAYLEQLAANYARLTPQAARERLDLNALVREIATAAGAGHDDALIEVVEAAALPGVVADAIALRRVVENLVANALESLPRDGGRVTITTSVVGAGVRLTVRDTGRGMSRAELERAFEDFFTTKQRGTGLGLSVVRRLVADLGGTLRVETAPGHGSTFTVELPVAGPAPTPTGTGESA
ncbi:MAG TPA: ATP-binding protein [Gemmatimonadales bacterium]|nr:ATP-binding protein [Gemmatimonadales bacterium]